MSYTPCKCGSDRVINFTFYDHVEKWFLICLSCRKQTEDFSTPKDVWEKFGIRRVYETMGL